MSTTHTLAGNLHDLPGGVTYSSRSRAELLAWAISGEGGRVMLAGTTGDEAGQIRIGGWPVAVNADGSINVPGLPGTGEDQGWLPAVQGYKLVVRTPDPATGREVAVETPWFELTADTNLADVVQAEVAALTTAAMSAAEAIAAATQAEGFAGDAAAAVTAALAAQTAAEAAAADAVDISNISTSDGVVSTLVEGTGGAGPLTRAALSATIAGQVDAAVVPVAARVTAATVRPQAAGVVTIGDSIAAYNSAGGNVWHKVLSLLSGGRLRHRGFFATGGYTLEQIETNHLPSVLAMTPKPGACIVAGGTNNVGAGGYNAATSRATWERIVATLKGAGIMPVGWTLPPRDDSTTVNGHVQRWNAWVRYRCQQLGIPLVDAHRALTDPATGLYVDAYDADSVHPTVQGHYRIGSFMAAQPDFLQRFNDDSPHLVHDVLDAANLIPTGRGLFNQGVNGAQVPTGWSGYGQGSSHSLSQVAGTGDVVGNWQVLKKTEGGVGDNTTAGGLQYNLTTGFAVGDRIALASRMKQIAPDSGLLGHGVMSVQARASGVTTLQSAMGGTGGTWEGVAYTELVIPSGTDTLRVDISIGATGAPTSDVTVQFAQATLLNLTALGL